MVRVRVREREAAGRQGCSKYRLVCFSKRGNFDYVKCFDVQ